MKKIKIGFLPLYIKLYDDTGNGASERPVMMNFYLGIAKQFEEMGFDVLTSEFCRIEPEFRETVGRFEREGADCIVTWHAAYSPSLESIKVLSETKLPIVVLDTTDTYDFSSTQSPTNISRCHGIHGVMDMCSMLRRYGKKFAIAAGHYAESNVIERVAGYVRAAYAATSLDGSRTASIGGSFDGMGDFLVPDEQMKSRFGVEIVYPARDELIAELEAVSDEDAEAEMAVDRENCYEILPVDKAVHMRTAKNCLAVRRWLDKNNIDAFTANFREVTYEDSGLEIMPFMEACKSMARGIGYAGEGDVLTASLVGALMKGFTDKAAFVEIFCPDWKGNTLLLSHMGEYNPKLIRGKAGMKEINFIFGDSENPIVSYACYRGGPAVFVNLYQAEDGFRLLISPVEMQDIKAQDDNFEGRVRGWMKPHIPVAEFLEAISRAGATHHSALIYDATPEQLVFFAQLCGLGYEII